jgi:hypothetical protein
LLFRIYLQMKKNVQTNIYKKVQGVWIWKPTAYLALHLIFITAKFFLINFLNQFVACYQINWHRVLNFSITPLDWSKTIREANHIWDVHFITVRSLDQVFFINVLWLVAMEYWLALVILRIDRQIIIQYPGSIKLLH